MQCIFSGNDSGVWKQEKRAGEGHVKAISGGGPKTRRDGRCALWLLIAFLHKNTTISCPPLPNSTEPRPLTSQYVVGSLTRKLDIHSRYVNYVPYLCLRVVQVVFVLYAYLFMVIGFRRYDRIRPKEHLVHFVIRFSGNAQNIHNEYFLPPPSSTGRLTW